MKRKIWYGGKCCSCKGINEPYMIQHELWKQVAKSKDIFLCLKCVETRLNRKLQLKDFLDAPINKGVFGFDAEVFVVHRYKFLTEMKQILSLDPK